MATLGANERASIALKFIIVGAGLAGISAAYALKRAGHDVLLLDRGTNKVKSRGNLQCPPNMTKILLQWGLGPQLYQKARRCSRFVLANGNTGVVLGSMYLDEQFLRELVSDFLFIQYQDLYDVLFSAAITAGVEFRRDSTSTVVNVDIDNIIVTLVNGECLKADVIVGADGHDSVLRPIVTDDLEEGTGTVGTGTSESGNGEQGERNLLLTFNLPVDVLNEDEELRSLLTTRDWIIWMGQGYLLHASLFNDGTQATATLLYKCRGARWENDEEWTDEHTLDFYHLEMNEFDPKVQKLLRLAKTISARTYRSRSTLEDLVCRQSRLVLIGSAAHPLLPGTNNATALSLEDSHTLGALFARLQSREQISQILTAYEEIRQPRASWVQEYEYHHLGNMRCSLEAQRERDETIKQTLACEDWDEMPDEELFRGVWGNELDIYAHNAEESVEEWWGQWGNIISRRREAGALSSTTNANCAHSSCEVVVTNANFRDSQL